MGLCRVSLVLFIYFKKSNPPNHAIILLLADIIRHLAIHLRRAQSDSQGSSHVVLYRGRNRSIPRGRSHPDVRGTDVFKVTYTCLDDVDTRNEGKNDIGREPLLQVGLYAQRACGIEQDACMLRRDDGFDNTSEVVDVRECFDAEYHVIVGMLARRRFFWCAHDWKVEAGKLARDSPSLDRGYGSTRIAYQNGV